jgi:hypothetical protein
MAWARETPSHPQAALNHAIESSEIDLRDLAVVEAGDEPLRLTRTVSASTSAVSRLCPWQGADVRASPE